MLILFKNLFPIDRVSEAPGPDPDKVPAIFLFSTPLHPMWRAMRDHRNVLRQEQREQFFVVGIQRRFWNSVAIQRRIGRVKMVVERLISTWWIEFNSAKSLVQSLIHQLVAFIAEGIKCNKTNELAAQLLLESSHSSDLAGKQKFRLIIKNTGFACPS